MSTSTRSGSGQGVLGAQLLDTYGFPLDLTEEEEEERERCYLTQMKATKQWNKYGDQEYVNRKFSSKSTRLKILYKRDMIQLKKNVRKVCPGWCMSAH